MTRRERKIQRLDAELRLIQCEKTQEATFACNESESAFEQRAREKGLQLARSGWPDFLVRDGLRVYAVEVKTTRDVISPVQRVMFALLEESGIPVYIWSPSSPGLLVPWGKRASRNETRIRERLKRLRERVAEGW